MSLQDKSNQNYDIKIHFQNGFIHNKCWLINTDFSDHDKLTEEGYEAEEEEEPFSSACLTHLCGKHINAGCHHHLHDNKL